MATISGWPHYSVATLSCEHCTKYLRQIRIGAHKDELWNWIGVKELKRPPLIVIDYPITSNTMTVASPYGGLIFVIVS